MDMRDSKSYHAIFRNAHPTLPADIYIRWYVDPRFQIPSRTTYLRAQAGDTDMRIHGPRWGAFCQVDMVVPQQAAAITLMTIWFFGTDLHLDDDSPNIAGGGGSLTTGPQYWVASASPVITGGAAEAVTNLAIVENYVDLGAVASYTVPDDKQLHITGCAMHGRPVAAAQAIGRIRIRLGSTTAGTQIFTKILQSGVQSTTAGITESDALTDNTFIVPAGTQFCFTIVAGATSITIDVQFTGWLEDMGLVNP
jgi:hypothetical protein